MNRPPRRHRATDPPDPRRLTGRDGLVAGLGGLGMAAVALGGGGVSKLVFPQRLVYGFPEDLVEPGQLPPTPASGHQQDATHRYEEGPFYAPNTPLKTDFRLPGRGGIDLLLRGRVVDTAGVPIAGAVLDFWQANELGAYDNVGYGYRGHQFTARDGRYSLRTVVPVPYSFARLWRFPHIHVKVQGPTTRLLTTQLFFDNDPHGYARHVTIDPTLLTDLRSAGDGSAEVTFDFVLRRTR